MSLEDFIGIDRPDPQWRTRTMSEQVAMAEALAQSPIEVTFLRTLVNASGFYINRTLPDLDDLRPHEVLLVPQHPVGRYRLDIAAFGRNAGGAIIKFDIECDGKAYHSTPEQIERDSVRDYYMQLRGWIVRRITGRDIHFDWAAKADELEDEIRDTLLGVFSCPGP